MVIDGNCSNLDVQIALEQLKEKQKQWDETHEKKSTPFQNRGSAVRTVVHKGSSP